MLTMFHAVKGGSGSTVATALAALAHRSATLLVDLDDELPHALGVGDADRLGAVDWLKSEAPLEHLDDLLIEVDDTTFLLATRRRGDGTSRHGTLPQQPLTRWMQLASWSRSWATNHNGRVLIDAGTRVVPDEFLEACDDRLLVTRSCYLSLREAARTSANSTGVVVIAEHGRSLGRSDIEAALGAPVSATLTWEPSIARAVDAGLLHSGRLHRPTARELARMLRSTSRPESAAA